MTEKDKQEFAKIMAGLAVIFNEELPPQKVSLFFELLKDYEIEVVKVAGNILGRTLRFFPKPVDFFDAIDGTMEERASKAWYMYLKALDRPGPYKTLNIGDPFAHAVIYEMDLWGEGIERNGYPDNRSDFDFIRQEFIKRYKSHSKHSAIQLLPKSLPGIFETVNQKKIAAGEDKVLSVGQIGYLMKNYPGLLPAPKETKELSAPEQEKEELKN